MNRRSTPEADAQRAIVQALRIALPRDAIVHHCANEIAAGGRVVSRRILKGRARRRLNPLFVGWLMGWPIGHALCACSEMEFTLWQRHMRGALSQLPMASGPWIWRPSDGQEGPAQMDLFEGQRP